MEQDKVSIILPIYNAEKYLEESVNSVLNQSYHNIQVILVNDGSQDDSWKICQHLKSKDSRVIIFTQKNSGVSVARNTGLDVADGKWIMFVDPDDILDPNIITNLMKETKNPETDIVACCCYGFNDSKRIEDHFFKENRLFSTNKTDLFFQLMDLNYGQPQKAITAIGVPWGKIYRRDFIEKNNLRFDPKLRRMQDNIFNMYAFYYADNIYYLNKPLYLYRLDHIHNYSERHLKSLAHIFCPVIKARYDGLNKLGLFNNPRIFEYYVNEATNMFFEIIGGLIQIDVSLRQLQQRIEELTNQYYFKIIFTKKGISNIKGNKSKIKLFLIKHKLIKEYTILYKMVKDKI